jgi:hypothetical protein
MVKLEAIKVFTGSSANHEAENKACTDVYQNKSKQVIRSITACCAATLTSMR